ncbi:methionine/alanine import family NSS transporter small subunit [Bacillus songklensis]|uniref:Methionine/alanine import family NSS transporter small subunit n=1 Tax=Bacillus songklensis TaxID=1069116 RepID=A0ABV8BBH3_9BACI
METSALIMMVSGMVIIWGGLGASITHAVKKAKESKA